MKMVIRFALRACILFLVMRFQTGFGCAHLFSGSLVLDVLSCTPVDTTSQINTWKKEHEWLANLSGDSLAKFRNSYTGEFIKARVNHAIPADRNKNYVGRSFTFLSKESKHNCGEHKGKRIEAEVVQICCHGSGNAPCLLDTAYVINRINAITPSLHSPKDVLSSYIQKNPKIKNALNLLDQKKYEQSISSLSKEAHDLISKYLLAFAFRNNGSPKQAIGPLEDWRKAFLDNSLSYDELLLAKDALLLLAKCYALERNSGKSVGILNIFLAKPKFFTREIQLSDTSDEFGWIKASKEWQDYQKRRSNIK